MWGIWSSTTKRASPQWSQVHVSCLTQTKCGTLSRLRCLGRGSSTPELFTARLTSLETLVVFLVRWDPWVVSVLRYCSIMALKCFSWVTWSAVTLFKRSMERKTKMWGLDDKMRLMSLKTQNYASWRGFSLTVSTSYCSTCGWNAPNSVPRSFAASGWTRKSAFWRRTTIS